MAGDVAKPAAGVGCWATLGRTWVARAGLVKSLDVSTCSERLIRAVTSVPATIRANATFVGLAHLSAISASTLIR